MANNATVALVYVETYESIVRHLAQQKQSRLRSWVMEKSVQSNGHNWELLGQADYSEKTAVGGTTTSMATPEAGPSFERRRSTPGTWHTGDLIEPEDIVQVLIDPNSNIAQAQAYAMNRAIDDEILNMAVRAADDGNGGAPVVFDADQIVGDYTTAITFDIVTQVTEKFMDNDIDPDEAKCMIISPAQARKLLQLTEATSGDYNAVRPLTSVGYIESWMGYTWIVSTRLNAPAADQAQCLCMTRKALGLQMNRDITTEVAKDPTQSFAWRIYAAATFGGVRVEDKHIVQIQLDDAAV